MWSIRCCLLLESDNRSYNYNNNDENAFHGRRRDAGSPRGLLGTCRARIFLRIPAASFFSSISSIVSSWVDILVTEEAADGPNLSAVRRGQRY